MLNQTFKSFVKYNRKSCTFNNFSFKAFADVSTNNQRFKHSDSASKFFDSCINGKGWDEIKDFCEENAEFKCDLLPFTNLQEYSNWKQQIFAKICPDAEFQMISNTWNNSCNQIVYVASFKGHHFGEGGPVPPSTPPKESKSDIVYIIKFNDKGNITHVRKIWDKLTAMKQWGFPLEQHESLYSLH